MVKRRLAIAGAYRPKPWIGVPVRAMAQTSRRETDPWLVRIGCSHVHGSWRLVDKADNLSNSAQCDNSGLPTIRSSPSPFASRMLLFGLDRVRHKRHMCADTERPGDRSDHLGMDLFCLGIQTVPTS